jgi:hypothetical protein
MLGACNAEDSGAEPGAQSQQQETATTEAEILPLNVEFLLQPVVSLEDLVARSDVVALVTPVETLPEYWPSDGNGVLVASRFVLRVDKVLQGDLKEGATIVAHTPGGTFAASFGATETQRPNPGDPVVRRQDFSRPFYRIGAQELVFLERLQGEGDLGQFYFDLGPQARYVVRNGELVAADQRVPTDPAQLADGDIRRHFVGKSVAEAERELRPILTRTPGP